jgi:type I restriction enzyme S subunit
MPSSTFSLNLKNSSENFKTNLFELEKYDLLFGSIRPYLLKAGFSPIKGAVNGSVLSFKPFEEYCFNFLLLTLTNKNMFEYAVFNSRGTRMPVVKYEDILNYKIAFDKNTVLKFSNLELKEIISNNINQNFELSELRDFLLPILMNGQVTIK